MHLSAVAPEHASHPGAHAVTADVSKKNLGAAYKHSVNVGPKHKTQLVTQALIVVIAELVELSVVPTKYFPHVSTGVQSSKVEAEVQVHLSVL